MRSRWTIAVLLCVSLALTSAAYADCPTGLWGPNSGPNTPFSGAILDVYQPFPGNTGPPYIAELHVNLVNGTTSATASGIRFTEISFVSGDLKAAFADEYTVIGPPSSTPLAFTAVLEARGSVTSIIVDLPEIGPVCETGDASSSIQEVAPGQSRAWPVHPCVSSNAINDDLSVPLLHLPGEPFVLNISVGANGGTSGASFTTQLRFMGLPPGYGVTSCHGFTQAAPVAVRHSNWAALKAHYR